MAKYRKVSRKVFDPKRLMAHGIEALDQSVNADDRIAQGAGAAVGLVVPAAAVSTTGAFAGISGGAAIMKTLAICGAAVGGGAVAGIAVLGVAAVAAGWLTTKAIKKLRNKNSPQSGLELVNLTSTGWTEFKIRVADADAGSLDAESLQLTKHVLDILNRCVWHYKWTWGRGDPPSTTHWIVDFLRIGNPEGSEVAQLILRKLKEFPLPSCEILEVDWVPLSALGCGRWPDNEASAFLQTWWRWSQIVFAVMATHSQSGSRDPVAATIRGLGAPGMALFVDGDPQPLLDHLTQKGVDATDLLAQLRSALETTGQISRTFVPQTWEDARAMEKLHLLMNTVWVDTPETKWDYPRH